MAIREGSLENLVDEGMSGVLALSISLHLCRMKVCQALGRTVE